MRRRSLWQASIARQSRDAVACALMSAHKAAQCCTDAVECALASAHKGGSVYRRRRRAVASQHEAQQSLREVSPQFGSDTNSTGFARGYFVTPGEKSCAIRTYPRNGRKVEEMIKVLLVIAFGRGCGGEHLLPPAHGHRGRSGRPATSGPWMSAFAYGTSYFSAVVFVGRGVSSTSSTVSRLPGPASATLSLARCSPGGSHRPSHPQNDPSPAGAHHAGVLRQRYDSAPCASRRRPSSSCSSSVHRERLQWSVASVRHGASRCPTMVRHRHGGGHSSMWCLAGIWPRS